MTIITERRRINSHKILLALTFVSAVILYKMQNVYE